MRRILYLVVAVIGLLPVDPCRAVAEEFREFVGDPRANFSQIQFSPDGRILAAVGKPTGSKRLRRGLVVLWNVESGEIIGKWKDFPDYCIRLAFSPDNRVLAVGCARGSTHLFGKVGDAWQRIEIIPMRPRDDFHWAEEFQFTADSRSLVTTQNERDQFNGMNTRGMVVIPLGRPVTERRLVPLPRGIAGSLHLLDEQGKRVLLLHSVPDQSPALVIVDTIEEKVVQTIQLPLQIAGKLKKSGADEWAVKATRDGKHIVVSTGALIYKLDPESYELKLQFDSGKSFIQTYSGMSLTQDGKLFATNTMPSHIRLWDFETGELLASREQKNINGAVLSEDGKWMASIALEERPVRVWNVAELIKAK